MSENANQSELTGIVFEFAKAIEKTNNQMYTVILVLIVSFCLTATAFFALYFLGDYNVPNQTIQTQSGGNSTIDTNRK